MDVVASTLRAPVGAPFPSSVVTLANGMSLGDALLEFTPLIYVTLFPLLAGLFALLGLCNLGDERSYKFGARTVMRRVILAVRAETRMGLESKHTKLMEKAGFSGAKGKPAFMQPTASAMEAGLTKARAAKSPDQSKAKAEEAKLKKVSPQK